MVTFTTKPIMLKVTFIKRTFPATVRRQRTSPGSIGVNVAVSACKNFKPTDQICNLLYIHLYSP